MPVVMINICNAAERIKDYPEIIQKLVWRGLQYKCEIETRNSESPTTLKYYEKLEKYIEALEQTQKIILKMCKKYNLNEIVIK